MYTKINILKSYPQVHQNVTVLGDRVLKSETRSYEWTLIQYDWCLYMRKCRHRQAQRKDHVKTRKTWPSVSQGEKPLKKLILLTSWSLIFSLQNCENISFCCLSYPVCIVLSWQPWKTNIVALKKIFQYPTLQNPNVSLLGIGSLQIYFN